MKATACRFESSDKAIHKKSSKMYSRAAYMMDFIISHNCGIEFQIEDGFDLNIKPQASEVPEGIIKHFEWEKLNACNWLQNQHMNLVCFNENQRSVEEGEFLMEVNLTIEELLKETSKLEDVYRTKLKMAELEKSKNVKTSA